MGAEGDVAPEGEESMYDMGMDSPTPEGGADTGVEMDADVSMGASDSDEQVTFKTIQKLWKASCLKEKIPFHATGEKGFYRLD